jgi:hypothetical protein
MVISLYFAPRAVPEILIEMTSWALINHQGKVVSGGVPFTRLLELLARL